MMPTNDSSPSVAVEQDQQTRMTQPIAESKKLLSQELFRNSNTVCIEHRGEHYWLRLTRGKKLILTK